MAQRTLVELRARAVERSRDEASTARHVHSDRSRRLVLYSPPGGSVERWMSAAATRLGGTERRDEDRTVTRCVGPSWRIGAVVIEPIVHPAG